MIPFYYILAASHSGSTLLTMLLGTHPGVATVGETSAVTEPGDGADSHLCSCQSSIETCPFWSAIRERLHERGFDWGNGTFQTHFRFPDAKVTDRVLRAEYQGPVMEAVRDTALAVSPTWRRRSKTLYASNAALVEEVMALTGAKVFVDSSKEPHRLKFLKRIDGFRPRVIHLVRDGRGVAGSYIRRDRWPMHTAADEWRRSIVSEEYILKQFASTDQIHVRYESLCSDVENEVARVLAFMGLDARAWERDFRSSQQHILGNRMRVGSSSEVKLDERWRTLLDDGQLAEFDRVAGDLNRKYGYT